VNYENASMDQGIAGVMAGVAGLLGAGIGGLATAYGARVGAQKTIEAAQTQVDRQSAFEHSHWVREQRRQVYSQLIELHATYQIAMVTTGVALDSGRPLSDEDRGRLHGQFQEFVEVVARADLWGPGEIVEKAHVWHRTVGERWTALLSWSRAIREGRTEDIQRFSDEFEVATAADGRARSAFIQAAVNALHI
jgi:hypothetical protein